LQGEVRLTPGTKVVRGRSAFSPLEGAADGRFFDAPCATRAIESGFLCMAGKPLDRKVLERAGAILQPR